MDRHYVSFLFSLWFTQKFDFHHYRDTYSFSKLRSDSVTNLHTALKRKRILFWTRTNPYVPRVDSTCSSGVHASGISPSIPALFYLPRTRDTYRNELPDESVIAFLRISSPEPRSSAVVTKIRNMNRHDDMILVQNRWRRVTIALSISVSLELAIKREERLKEVESFDISWHI